ncbi:PREDICTED: uncharacterized protein LOC106309230 [Brassica oleracea var. oleracea]|uniref:uncharacterized protein LOC106309230 n=1 Tax=Brassica oleracea var. oleracea TaxID=109376 RepID=UPI0006A70F96|nr:PREDICTED: uncharacterized protein LOC106309230 [Brassica oleracea var. oleracea]
MVEESIGFHLQCKEINLSHLSFADDIVVFTDGSPMSLQGTLKVFEDFAAMSGLQINIAKSTVFAAGRGKQVLEDASADADLSVSALPIRYLGLPLTTKIMCRDDYEPLITKKPVPLLDEQSALICSGSPNISSRAKVSWEEVCCPYEEGGLGIRRVSKVCMVFQLKLIWRLFAHSSSLWVLWVKQYLLREDTFWDVRDTGLGSWMWRKMFTVRFWTDIWHPRGRLIEFAGEIGTHRLGIRRDMKIKDVFRDGVWRFRRCRDPFIRSMIAEIEASNICLTDGRDAVLWKRGADDYVSKFVSSETRAVNWGSLAMLSSPGLPYETNSQLVIVQAFGDNHRLKVTGNLFGREPDPDWDITLSRLLTGSYNRHTFILLRLVLQVSMYHIWRERNERKHHTSNKLVDQLEKQPSSSFIPNVVRQMPGAAHADSTTSLGKSSLPSAQPSSTNRSKSSAENVYK